MKPTDFDHDFWSVNEDEPGIGGVMLAFLVLAGLMIFIPALIWILGTR